MGNRPSASDATVFVRSNRHEVVKENVYLTVYKERDRFFSVKTECWVVRSVDQRILLTAAVYQMDALWTLVTRLEQTEALVDWSNDQLHTVLQLKVDRPAVPTAHLLTMVGAASMLAQLTDQEIAEVDGGNGRATTLHVAAAHRSYLCVVHLLDRAPEQLLAEDAEGRTPLRVAVHTLNNADCVYALVQHALLTAPADAPESLQGRCRQQRGEVVTAALAAVRRDFVQNAEAFLSTLLDSAAILPELPAASLVHEACRAGAVGCIRAMARRCPDQLLIPSAAGHAPLQIAAQADQGACVAVLLEHTPANHWLRVDPAGETVLHAAAGAPGCVRQIMDACRPHFGPELLRAFVDTISTAGETALSRAVRGAEVASVKELLQAGADRGVKDASGATPLHLAVALDSTAQAWEVTRALLDLPGAPIHELDATGYAPLHLAVVGGRAGVAQLLLRANASPDHRTAAGDGACHLAVFARQPLCLRALIESGQWIDLEAVGSLGKTPGQLCDYTDDSLMRWLLELEVRQSKAKGAEGMRPLRDTAVMAAESTALPPDAVSSASEMDQDAQPTLPLSTSTEPLTPLPYWGPAVTSSSSSSSAAEARVRALERELQDTKEILVCKVCCDKPIGTVFLPCGHVCCCPTCALCSALCPICRQPIQASHRVYHN